MTAIDTTATVPQESAGSIAAEQVIKNSDRRITTRSRLTRTGRELVYVVDGREFKTRQALATALQREA